MAVGMMTVAVLASCDPVDSPLARMAGGLTEAVTGNAVHGRPQACELRDIHIYDGVPADLGSGVVASDFGATLISGGGGASSGVRLSDCEAGATLSVFATESDGVNEDRAYDMREAADAFRGRMGSIQSAGGLEAYQNVAAELGLRTSMQNFRYEPCGCAAFYPDALSDDIRPYRGRTQ